MISHNILRIVYAIYHHLPRYIIFNLCFSVLYTILQLSQVLLSGEIPSMTETQSRMNTNPASTIQHAVRSTHETHRSLHPFRNTIFRLASAKPEKNHPTDYTVFIELSKQGTLTRAHSKGEAKKPESSRRTGRRQAGRKGKKVEKRRTRERERETERASQESQRRECK